ncbi:hypothetical protein HOF92_05685 [bacterium]|jgi:hypothetical protein|nr:hypothetical protein [bacterium]
MAVDKQRDERHRLEEFLLVYNQAYHRSLRITDQPDPPDAFCEDSIGRVWIEETRVHESKEQSRIIEAGQLQVPDQHDYQDRTSFYEAIKLVIERKLGKDYTRALSTHGRGILVLFLRIPSFTEEDYQPLVQYLQKNLKLENEYFKEIFLLRRSVVARQGLKTYWGIIRVYPSLHIVE